MWKVRFIGDDGNLVEAEAATLADVLTNFDQDRIRVVQRVLTAAAPAADAAEGTSAIAVEKA